MKQRRGVFQAALSVILAVAAAPAALAQGVVDLPHDWELWLRPAATPVREHINSLNDALLIIISLITLFVIALLLYAIFKFNAKSHPVPSKTTHHALIEVIWTVVPVLILVTIAIPSFKLMYYMDRVPHADMTLKATGHQWYWSYQYPDQGNLSFDTNMLPQDEAIKEGKPRLLAVDNPVVVPVGAVVRVLITSTDVIHSWFMPSLGVQEYAIIGRNNEAWFQIQKPGTYYGQCNQICGINHPFMPIEVQAVSKDDFQKWLADAKKKFAHDDDPAAPRLAALR